MTWLWVTVAILAAYLLGGVPFGLIIGKLKGVDIREHGSRNIGATNAGRVLGKRYFFLVTFLDAAKGAIACGFGKMAEPGSGADLMLFAGLGALLGHFFSPYLKFRGGKGVATGLGVVISVASTPDTWLPIPAFCGLGVFILLVLITRTISIGSVLAVISLPGWYALFAGEKLLSVPYAGRFAFFCVMAVLMVAKHRSNIVRIAQGAEPKIGSKPREQT